MPTGGQRVRRDPAIHSTRAIEVDGSSLGGSVDEPIGAFPGRSRMSTCATFNGQTIARSDDVVVVEGNHYFPVDDVRMDVLEATSRRTLCPWKGIASYWTVEVDGVQAENAAWGYRRPSPLARRVKGRLAFSDGVAVHSG